MLEGTGFKALKEQGEEYVERLLNSLHEPNDTQGIWITDANRSDASRYPAYIEQFRHVAMT